MGAMTRASLAASSLALLLSSVRGFLLPSAVTSSSTAAISRHTSPCFGCSAARAPASPFTGYTRSIRPAVAYPRRGRTASPASASVRCGAVGATAKTCMRAGGGFLMPGGGRKLAFVAIANAAAFATVGGGVLAGGLHAVSGPDHLAALLPRIMGQKWHNSMRIGATWGLGHGFSATIIGLVAFFFKDRLGLGHNERLVAMMGTWTEGLVGVSLIAIGLLGLKESLLDYEEAPAFEPKSAGSAVVEGGGGGGALGFSKGGGKAVFLNGVLHGFSWDGAPSLAPALALSSWASVLWFLLAYCSGTMVAMSATTTLIGEGSVRVGEALDKPDIPRKLSVVSSVVAIAIGAVWLAKAALF